MFVEGTSNCVVTGISTQARWNLEHLFFMKDEEVGGKILLIC
jgi:hypothetical protein